MASLGDLMIRVGANLDAFNAAMADVNKQLDKTARDAEKSFSGFDKLAGNLQSAGATLSAVFTLPAAALTGFAVKATTDMESLRLGLEAVAGSSGEAEKQLVRLKEVAKLPGLGLGEATQGSVRLQAVGVAAQESERYLMAFGNALATVGKGRADLDAVITQLVQMASKTKVLANDLRPIMERVPQVAKITKDAFGTIDTEELQKMGITTKEFIETIVSGLEELPKVSSGLRVTFENISDAATIALDRVGRAFTPLIEKAAPLVEGLLDKLGDLADWFTSLPGPVQAAVGVIAGFLAALGPIAFAVGGIMSGITALTAALAPIATVVGVTTAAFAGWLAVIPLALAALTALGVWIYGNWDAITAVVSQAWEGITEIWGAVWGPVSEWLVGIWEWVAGAAAKVWEPIGAFFSTIWDAIGPYFSAAWNGIKDALSAVWGAIKASAAAVWGGIVSVFQTFLEWAAKIPGVNKLFTLDEAWKQAKKLQEAVEDGTKAQKEGLKQAEKFGDGHKKQGPKLADFGKQTEAAAKKVKALKYEDELLEAKLRSLKGEHEAAARWLADYATGIERNQESTFDLERETEKLRNTIDSLSVPMGRLADIQLPAFAATSSDAALKTGDLNTALRALGITSSTEYARAADEARKAYEVVMGSSVSTAWERDNAMLKMLRAQVEQARINGQVIPAETQKTIDALEQKVSTGLPKVQDKFKDFGNEVSTIVTNFTQDIARSLFDGELSWGEKAKSMLKSLGEATVSMFIQPATDAIAKFIAGALSDLIGGKGFGAVLDGLKGIGSAISGVFGGGGGKFTGMGAGIGADSAGVGGGVGGAVGGAASGLTGVVGAIGSVGSAISGVIGNFQMSGMNKSLDVIVQHTLQTANQLIYGIQPALNTYLPAVSAIHDRLRQIIDSGIGVWNAAGDQGIRIVGMDLVIERLGMMGNLIADVIRGDSQRLERLSDIRDGVVHLSQRNMQVTINVSGGDPQATANEIMRRLQAQGAFA